MADGRPLVVLLLPERLEAFEHRALAERLLRAEGVVAVDPPRLPYRRQGGWSEGLGVLVASRQARRLVKRLPGTVAAVAIFEPAQYRLARAIHALQGAELWYGPAAAPEAGSRLEELHRLAAERASVRFGPDGEAAEDRLVDVLG